MQYVAKSILKIVTCKTISLSMIVLNNKNQQGNVLFPKKYQNKHSYKIFLIIVIHLGTMLSQQKPI